MFAAYDVIVDGTDNFPTRYLVNDACVLLGKPNVYGSIFRFDGQATVFFPPEGPCYRCLYPEPPPPGPRAQLRRGGRAGHPAGLDRGRAGDRDGQADPGEGKPLVGRLLLYDALEMTFREMKVRKNPRARSADQTRRFASWSITRSFAESGAPSAGRARRGPGRDHAG